MDARSSDGSPVDPRSTDGSPPSDEAQTSESDGDGATLRLNRDATSRHVSGTTPTGGVAQCIWVNGYMQFESKSSFS